MKALCIALVAALALVTPLRAEPGPIGEWLMAQPLTLWDIGMIRAGEEAARAAKESSNNLGFSRWGGAIYEWDNNEIDLYMYAVGYEGDPTHQKCNEARRAFIQDIVYMGPQINEDALRIILQATISRWFSHEGWQKQIRDKEIGLKMARIIFVKVQLSGQKGVISCRDRITAFEAPSKPLERIPAE